MINALVVIYNKSLEESAACMSLLRQKGSGHRIYLWDNSESEFNLEKSCKRLGWTYLGGNGNVGLSKAYNETTAMLLNACGENDYLCLLDDDTELPEDYFSVAEQFIKEKTGSILLPIVYSSNEIVSPWRDTPFRSGRFFKAESACLKADAERLLAFNTGMLIPVAVLKNKSLRYDEKLFMDWVDISFLKNAKKSGTELSVMPVKLNHSFSARDSASPEYSLKRFKGFIKDTEAFYESKALAGRLIIMKRALSLSLKYKSMEFIKLAIKRGNRE